MSLPPKLPPGRVQRMVEWLLRLRTHIERMSAGSVVFHIGPRSITVELHERHPQERVDPDQDVTDL